MEFVPVRSLDEIWQQAVHLCGKGPQFDLVLAHEFEIDLVDSEFVSLFREKAEEWQSETPPVRLPFSHGQFFRGKRGVDHVITELKAKSGSRRALLSLISMEDILGRGDEPIPSFLVMQFGVEGSVLYVTAYFRALEVSQFLKINITEICLIIRRIREEFQTLKQVRLLLVAFRAYEDREFVLERASIDIEPRGCVAAAVAKGEYEKLIEWLEDKKKGRSLIEPYGLEEMRNAMSKFAEKYPPKLRGDLQNAITALVRLRELRQKASESEKIDQEYRGFVGLLGEIIEELRRMRNR